MLATEYRFPTCFVTLLNSYATKNTAMFAGVINIESLNSIFFVKNSVFEENTAFNYIQFVGGGSDIMGKGDSTTQIYSENNLFFNAKRAIAGYF